MRARMGHRSGRDHAFRARHDRRDQRGAGAQGRPHRPDHHRRVQGRARNRPADAASDVRSRAASRRRRCFSRLARAARRCASASDAKARSSRSLDENDVRARCRRTGRATVSRPSRSVFLFSFSIRRMSGASATIIAAAHPGLAGVAVVRGRSGVPRIRANLRHRVRCLYQTGGRRLSRQHGAETSRRPA